MPSVPTQMDVLTAQVNLAAKQTAYLLVMTAKHEQKLDSMLVRLEAALDSLRSWSDNSVSQSYLHFK